MTSTPSRRWSSRTSGSSSRSPELPQPGPAFPRFDPGRHARPGPCGREVRLPQGISSSRPTRPGGSARRSPAPSPTRPDHPDPGPRCREAEQDRPCRAQAGDGTGPRAHPGGDRRSNRHRPRGEVDSIKRSPRPVSLEKPVGDGRNPSSASSLPTRRPSRPDRAADLLTGQSAEGIAGEPLLPRAPRARAPLRARRRAPRTLDEVGAPST